jgi:hypothetical protein
MAAGTLHFTNLVLIQEPRLTWATPIAASRIARNALSMPAIDGKVTVE